MAAFAVAVLALLTQPVAYTLHLREVNLVLDGVIAADLLRRNEGAGSATPTIQPISPWPA